MEFKDIDILIKKYFDGESSIEEETIIHSFFEEKQELPEKYTRLKAMFSFYKLSRNEKSELKFENIVPKIKKKNKVIQMTIYAAAASIIVFLGFWFLTNNTNEKPVYAYINGKPVENQEIAYKEAQKALMMVSKNLNEGAQNVKHLSELNKAVEIIGSK